MRDSSGLHSIILECDERFHAGYDASCEVRREQDVTSAMLLGGETRPIAWVRMNPHPSADYYDKRDVKLEKQRHAEAVQAIRDLLENPRSCVVYIGYPAERIAELTDARAGM